MFNDTIKIFRNGYIFQINPKMPFVRYKGGSKTTTETKNYTPAQEEWMKKALELYGPELGQGADIFPGERVTPFSELQQKAITGAGTFADYFADPKDVGTPLFQETGTAVKGLLAGETGAKPISPQDTEDYFGRAIYDPTMKQFREDTIPGIAESFAGPGFFGSARSQEQSKAYQDVGDYLSTQRAGLEWDVLGRNQALEEGKAGRTLATLPGAMAYGQVPAQEIQNNLKIAGAQLGGLSDIFGFGAREQTQEQTELQDEIIRFAEENQITDPQNLAILLQLLGTQYQSTTQVQKTGGSSPWGAIGALGGMALGGLIAGPGAFGFGGAGGLTGWQGAALGAGIGGGVGSLFP